MARKHPTTSRRSLSQRLGSQNVLSDGLLPPIDPTDIANFQIMQKAPKEKGKGNR